MTTSYKSKLPRKNVPKVSQPAFGMGSTIASKQAKTKTVVKFKAGAELASKV
jgi:hypothetical protein